MVVLLACKGSNQYKEQRGAECLDTHDMGRQPATFWSEISHLPLQLFCFLLKSASEGHLRKFRFYFKFKIRQWVLGLAINTMIFKFSAPCLYHSLFYFGFVFLSYSWGLTFGVGGARTKDSCMQNDEDSPFSHLSLTYGNSECILFDRTEPQTEHICGNLLKTLCCVRLTWVFTLF